MGRFGTRYFRYSHQLLMLIINIYFYFVLGEYLVV